MKKPNEEKAPGKKHKAGVVIFRIVVVVLLLIVILLLLHKQTQTKQAQAKQDAISEERERSAQLGILPGMSDEEIQDALNRQVEQGMLNVSMNPLPVFENGTSEGNVRIQNIAGNHYSIRVRYVRSDTGDTILTTKYIDPGYYVENMKLDKPLPKGRYLCVANVDAFDPKTLAPVGQTGMEVVITVNN